MSTPARQSLKAHKEATRASGHRKKRPAFNLTCSNCRRRKMRCDSGQPGCLICAAYGDVCTYDKTPPVSQVVAMAKRLHHLEDVVSKLRESQDEGVLKLLNSAETSTTELSDKNVSQQLSHMTDTDSIGSSSRLSEATPDRKMSLSSVVNPSVPSVLSELSMSADGQLRYYGSTSAVYQPVTVPPPPTTDAVTRVNNDESRTLLVTNASQSRNWEDFALGNGALQLDIPRETITKLLDTHWTWVQPMFMFTYRPAFMSDMSTGGPYFTPFLLSAICAHSTRFLEKHLAETLMTRVRMLMASEIQKDSSIPTIQALLQLSGREIGQGRISQAWLFSGMAFRMSTDLGLHLSTDSIASLGHPLSAQDKEIRNRLSWACFLWDKAMSLYLGRTPTIQEPPNNEPNFLDDFAENETWVPFFPLDSPGPPCADYPSIPSRAISCFTNFCKLSVIVNEIVLQLYGRTRPCDIPAFVSDARQKLDEWWQASPSHLRINTYSPPAFCPPPHIMTVCLLYYTTVILLHRPLGDVEFAKTASREASRSMQVLLQLIERTFGFTRTTYLMAYCAYTGATVAVEDMKNGIPGADQSVRFFIRALEGARRLTCPSIGDSLDIIRANIVQNCPEKLAMLGFSHAAVSQIPQMSAMPAFPYQPVQIDYGSQANAFAIDPAISSAMLNSYPQHVLNAHDGEWLPRMHQRPERSVNTIIM